MRRTCDLFWPDGGWLELTACSNAIYSQSVSLDKSACALCPQSGLETGMQDQAVEEEGGGKAATQVKCTESKS